MYFYYIKLYINVFLSKIYLTGKKRIFGDGISWDILAIGDRVADPIAYSILIEYLWIFWVPL